MTGKPPFFSIVIPTYNRPHDLKRAVKSVTRQSFKDFEIIVSDNSSTENTKKVCLQLKEKRIKYFHNRYNVGLATNLYRGIKRSKGKYIFILGDDDFLVERDLLSEVYSLIKSHDFGYVRVPHLVYKNLNELFFFERFKQATIRENETNINIYRFIYQSAFYFISGLVFKNNKKIVIPELEHNIRNARLLFEGFWIEYIYQSIKSSGGLIMDNKFLLARLSRYKSEESLFYNVDGRKMATEKIWSLIFKKFNKEEKETWISESTLSMIKLLPSIKYYTNNINLYKHIKRMIQLNKQLLFKPSFYLFVFVSFMMVKPVWNVLRNLKIRLSLVNDQAIIDDVLELTNRK